jgi:spore germination protein GerM
MKKKTIKYILVTITAALLIIIIVKLTGQDYYQDKEYTWYVASGAKDDNLLIRGTKIDKIKNDINKLIYALNKSKKDPETFRTPENKEPTDLPKLKLKDIKENVVNVEVINHEYLTQRMGSTGADEYLAVATFTLTENDHIKSVNFIFEVGDHASPGLYSREYFLKNWKVTK